MSSLQRSSLGRSSQLGELYNAKTDTLTGHTLFKKAIPPALIQSSDIKTSNYEFLKDDSLDDKFRNLSVEGQLKASYMAGMLFVGGSGKYLFEEKKSHKSVKIAMIYDIRTKTESIDLTKDDFKPLIATEVLGTIDATHVVVGIDWGAKSVATFEHENSENSEKRLIEGKLDGSLKKISARISGSGKLDDDEKKVCDRVSIKYYGDFIAPGQLPTTVDEAINLMKNVPNYMQTSNAGKGVALELKLMPIEELGKIVKIEEKIDRWLVELKEDSINLVQQELDKFIVKKQRFYDLKGEIVEENENFFQDSEIAFLVDEQNNMQQTEIQFRNKLYQLFVGIRSGKIEPSEMDSFLLSFKQDSIRYSPEHFSIEKKRIFDRFKQIQDFKKLGIQFLGKKDSLPVFIQSNSARDVYVLVSGDRLRSTDCDNYMLVTPRLNSRGLPSVT